MYYYYLKRDDKLWETIVTKVHSQTLMAMKSGVVLPTIWAMCPQKIIPLAKVPLRCNFANKSSLF